MKLKVRIIDLDGYGNKELSLQDKLNDLEDYQVKHITQKDNEYTVFYCKDSDKRDDIFEETKKVQHKEPSTYFDEIKKVEDEKLLYNTRFEKLNKGIQFTKTTDLFKSPYTGPINLEALNKEVNWAKRSIKSVCVNGKSVNWHMGDNGNIIVDDLD